MTDESEPTTPASPPRAPDAPPEKPEIAPSPKTPEIVPTPEKPEIAPPAPYKSEITPPPSVIVIVRTGPPPKDETSLPKVIIADRPRETPRPVAPAPPPPEEPPPPAVPPPPPPEKPEIAPPPERPEIAPPPEKPEAEPPPEKPEAEPPPEKPEAEPPPNAPPAEPPPENLEAEPPAEPSSAEPPSAESPLAEPPSAEPSPAEPPLAEPPLEESPLAEPPSAEPPEQLEAPPVVPAPRVVRRASPRIAALTPASGFLVGGMEVTISGEGFDEGCSVEIAGVALNDVTYDSENAIRITTPRQDAVGAVAVTVVNPTGLAHCVREAFLYERLSPRVDTVSPSSCPNAGGTRLTLKGDGFGPGSSVFICGIATPMTFKSIDEIEVTAPAVSRDGPADVRVVNGDDDQAHILEKAFRYVAPMPEPKLSVVSPGRGAQAGGLKVAILGDDFAEGVVVRFGGVLAKATFLTRKELSALSPAHAGAGEVDVEVENPDGATSRLESAFAYDALPAPQITSVEPKSGPTTGGTKLVIEGLNFVRESQVYIGREYPKDMTVKSATEIHAVTPPRKTAGVVDVEVTSPGTPKAVKPNAFRYDATPAPTLTSVSPNRVGTSGGEVITLSGTNFLKETAVLVDNKAVKGVKFVDKSTLEFKAPGGVDGKMADVAVRNPDGKEAVQKRAFMFDARYG